MSNNAIDLDSIQQIRSDTMSDITELQNIERDYFSKLQTGLMEQTLSSQEKNDLITKINEISQIRVNLYRSLGKNYAFYQDNISSTHDTMEEQAAAISVVEKELNDSKRRLSFMEDEKYNKLRLIEINTYYSDLYADHTSIMKLIIYIFIAVLIITILRNRGILPVNIFNILFVIIVVIGVILLVYHLIYTITRDNMNYREYDWYFNKSNAPDVDLGSTNVDPWESSLGLTCVGQACCDEGYVYDSDPTVNKCGVMPAE